MKSRKRKLYRKVVRKKLIPYPYAARPFRDSDKDGVVNIFDCRPGDKKKQGILHTGTQVAMSVLAPVTKGYAAVDKAMGGILPGGVPAPKKVTAVAAKPMTPTQVAMKTIQTLNVPAAKAVQTVARSAAPTIVRISQPQPKTTYIVPIKPSIPATPTIPHPQMPIMPAHKPTQVPAIPTIPTLPQIPKIPTVPLPLPPPGWRGPHPLPIPPPGWHAKPIPTQPPKKLPPGAGGPGIWNLGPRQGPVAL
jgi:hypothetical protein